MLGTFPYVKTLACANGVDVGPVETETKLDTPAVGDGEGDGLAAADEPVVGKPVVDWPSGTTGPEPGFSPGGGNMVPGGSVGNGAGVGITGNGGPGKTLIAPGLTICGVTVMMSSLREWLIDSLRKSLPITGRSPKKGILMTLRLVLSCISPPITRV